MISEISHSTLRSLKKVTVTLKNTLQKHLLILPLNVLKSITMNTYKLPGLRAITYFPALKALELFKGIMTCERLETQSLGFC